uniref:Abnormal spindle-like microcephaly-associated protein ASH domain-containing protein n=1 Tax=Panagrolaimus superbus TaxID=310955 RepID=A0A914Z7E6_9BILA
MFITSSGTQYNENRDFVKTSGKSEKNCAPMMDTVPETRKASISFGKKSFGKPDYFETVIRQSDAEECRQRNHLRSRQDAVQQSKMESKNPLSSFSYRSSKPSNSNMTTRSIPHNSSKPLTSTPKSERNSSRSRFSVEVSDIYEKTKNYSQNLSNASLNGMIKNIDLNQSSTLIAKNFQSNIRAPKNSKLIEEIRRKRETSDISVRSNYSSVIKPQARQPNIHTLPNFPQIAEHRSLSSRPSTSASDSVEIAIKPEPLTHFGFVAIGEEVQAKVYVRNHSTHVLEITPKLKSRSFKLALSDPVQIHPNSSHEFCVIFLPTECTKCRHSLRFYVASSGKTYSHTLLGYGGTADIKIIEKRCLSYYPLSGVYRFVPSNISAFEYEVENFGDRTAFVHIISIDSSGREAKNITVNPKSFCLASKNNNASKTNITVNIPESYLQELCRMSMESVTSASSTKRNNIFTLQVYFGDERLRQRAKRYSEESKMHEIFQGLSLTNTRFPNLNGEEAALIDFDRISIQDLEMLKSQTRVLTILVGDDRTNRLGTHLLHVRPPSSFLNRELLEDGYYIPECNVEGDSTFLTVADNDRTFRR